MIVRFPPKLSPGDLIAVMAPSSGVSSNLHDQLDRAINNLRMEGFRVIEGECLRLQVKNKSADKTLRAKELMFFLTDPEIKAIMPPWGGDLAMEILELMDFECLAQTQPKWFVGFSDLSTIQFPLTTISGWATLHGPNLMQLSSKELDPNTQALWHLLGSERGSLNQQHSSPAFHCEDVDGGATRKGFNLTQRTQWKRLDSSRSPITFSGHLIGGCLEIISRLAGTPYGDLTSFKAKACEEGVILYFENVEMLPCELTRALLSLRLQGWFNNLSGILIGRSAAKGTNDPDKHNYLDALITSLADMDTPVLYDVDIGHVPPQLSLINGAFATVQFTEGGSIVTQRI